MSPLRVTSLRILSVAVMSLFVTAGAISNARADQSGADEMRQKWMKHRLEWIVSRLAKIEHKMDLSASQQDAWNEYVKALVQPLELSINDSYTSGHTGKALDQVDLTFARGKKAAQVANATSKLRDVLTPEQRKILDQDARGVHNASIRSVLTLPSHD